jgi:hypothetical protein
MRPDARFRKIGRVSAAFLAAIVITCSGCKHSLKSDPHATDALMALKRLQAKTETGIAYHDYSVALGDANFPVKLFLESENARTYPVFASSLRDAMKWYEAAAKVWERQIAEDHDEGYCDIQKLSEAHSNVEYAYYGERDVRLLCEEYPELVRPIQNPPYFDFKVPGMLFTIAEWDSWKRSAFSLKNAEHSLKGEQLDKPEISLLRTDDKAALAQSAREALKRLGVTK